MKFWDDALLKPEITAYTTHKVSLDMSALTQEQATRIRHRLVTFGHNSLENDTLFIHDVKELTQLPEIKEAAQQELQPRISQALLQHYEPQREVSFKIIGEPSQEYINEVKRAFDQLPEQEKAFLGAMGVTIAIGKIRTDCQPHALDQLKTPSPNDPRTHANQAGGCYDPTSAVIIMAEYSLSTSLEIDPIEASRRLHNTGTINSYWTHNLKRAADTLRHEAGHAISFTMWHPEDPGLSMGRHMESFSDAYLADLERMGEAQGAAQRGLEYFVRADNPSKGQEETLAELWASENSSAERFDLKRHFPYVHKWIQDFRAEFHRAAEWGPKSIADFIYAFNATRTLTPPPSFFTLEQRRAATTNPGTPYPAQEIRVPVAHVDSSLKMFDRLIANQKGRYERDMLCNKLSNATSAREVGTAEENGTLYVTMSWNVWRSLTEHWSVSDDLNARIAENERKRTIDYKQRNAPKDLNVSIQTVRNYDMKWDVSSLSKSEQLKLFDAVERTAQAAGAFDPSNWDMVFTHDKPDFIYMNGVKDPDIIQRCVENYLFSAAESRLAATVMFKDKRGEQETGGVVLGDGARLGVNTQLPMARARLGKPPNQLGVNTYLGGHISPASSVSSFAEIPPTRPREDIGPSIADPRSQL